MDSRQEAALARLLASYQGTLLVIDHNLLFLYTLCQRGIVLANGQIVHDTSMRDLAHHSHSLREHALDFTFRFCCCGHDHPPLAEKPHRHHFLQHHHSAAGSHQREDNPAIPLIELQHFHYAYPDGTAALTDINLTIHHGERLALIGENGAGKSTLAGCLLGLHPGEGRYFLKGAELAPGQRGQLWRQLGMVFQNADNQLQERNGLDYSYQRQCLTELLQQQQDAHSSQ